MRPLAVVMVSAGFWPAVGGAERQALEQSAALAARGHRVVVLTRRLEGLPRRQSLRGVEIVRLPAPGPAAFMASVLGWLLLRWTDWDAVHAHLAGSPAVAAALAGRLLGRPALVKLGGGRGIGELAESSKTAAGRLKLRALSALRPRFLAVAADLAEEAREFLGGVDVEVLPNGVDAARFAPADAAARRAARESLGWPEDAVVFLYTGRLSREKRLPWFAARWKDAAGPRARLVLVGDGAEREALEAEAAGSGGRMAVLPPVDDAAGLYAAADVFVLPSVSEGLSNSLLEAMASGLPALASRVGGTAEAAQDGVTGLLFEKDDEEAAREAVRRLTADAALRRRLGLAARERAAGRFGLDRTVSRLERLYLSTSAR